MHQIYVIGGYNDIYTTFVPDIVFLTIQTSTKVKPNMKTAFPLLFLLMTVIGGHVAHSQAVASEAKVEHTNSEKIAAVIELPYPVEEVEEVIKDYLAKKGVKSDRLKGFEVFRNARLKENDIDLQDLHFKVERKSRKEKDITRVYLLVARPNENLATRHVLDRHKVDEAKAFLNGVVPSVESHHLSRQIGSQEEAVRKAEKKMKDLTEDQQDLEEKIKSLQEKLVKNKEDQQKQTEELTKEKNVLDAMKARKN